MKKDAISCLKNPERFNTLVKAVEQHGELLAVGARSVSDDDGGLLVLYSAEERDELLALATHAHGLRARHESERPVEVLAKPDFDVALEAINNPDYSRVAMLGHGAIGAMRLYNRTGHSFRHVSWYDLATQATHLKTGPFEQRFCGVVSEPDKHVRVPLGTFVVADQRQVLAPVHMLFPDTAGISEFDAKLAPIYAEVTNTATELRRPLLT